MTREKKLKELDRGREAPGVLSPESLKVDPDLDAAGWERRFVADAARAVEAMELYAQLGFEVRAEPLRPADLRDECEECRLVSLLGFKTIYIRNR